MALPSVGEGCVAVRRGLEMIIPPPGLFRGLGFEQARYGGEGGIRTHGPFQDYGFRDRPIRPLSHLSALGPTKCAA